MLICPLIGSIQVSKKRKEEKIEGSNWTIITIEEK